MGKCEVCGKVGGKLYEAKFRRPGLFRRWEIIKHCPTCVPVIKGDVTISHMQWGPGKRDD